MKKRIIVMGIISILIAGVIGCVGIMSVNSNLENSDVEAAAYEIDMLRSQNQENEALYQYHVEQTYLDNINANFEHMAQMVEQIGAGESFGDSFLAFCKQILSGGT